MKKNPLRVFAAAKQADELLLYIYDDIGAGWFSEGVTAKGIADEIGKAGKIAKITMRINSPGGDVFEGIAILNLLKAQSVPINVMIDGLAASAASVLAMAGDTISIADNALIMIHNAWTVTMGDAAEMRKTADTLDKVSGVITDTYAKRTKMPAAMIQALMDEETWMTASEAITNGFADEITKTDKAASESAQAVAASFDLSRFKNTPEKFKVKVEPTKEEQPGGIPALVPADQLIALAQRDRRARHSESILRQ